MSDLNFYIPPNSITTISGKLGAGKSLLLNIIASFYTPVSGNILFDKIPLKNLDKASLRNLIGLYMEDMKIIKASLKNNITLGRKDIQTNDILELAKKIGIDDLSSQFSNGFNTELSETYTEISFNVKKKILILRALLGDHRLLILEDPLGGMDANVKSKMSDYLQSIKENTTIIIVSESQELLNIADQRLFLQDGKITHI